MNIWDNTYINVKDNNSIKLMKIKDVDFKEIEKVLKQYFYNAYEAWHMMKDLEKHVIRRYETRTRVKLSKYMIHRIINCLTSKGYARACGLEEVNTILDHKKVGPIHQWSLK